MKRSNFYNNLIDQSALIATPITQTLSGFGYRVNSNILNLSLTNAHPVVTEFMRCTTGVCF